MAQPNKTDLCNIALAKLGSSRLQLSDFDTDTGETKDQLALQFDTTLEQLVRMHRWNCCKTRKQLSTPILTVTEGSSIVDLNISETDDVTTVNEERRINRYTATDRILSYDGTKFIYTINSDPRNDSDTCLDADLNIDPLNFSFTATTKIEPSEGTYTVSDSHLSFSSVTIAKKKPIFEYDNSFKVPSDCVRVLYLTSEKNSYNFLKPKVDWITEGDTILSNYEEIYLCYDAKPLPEKMDSLFREAFTTLLAHNISYTILSDLTLSKFLLEQFNNVIMPEARRVNGFENHKLPVVDSEWLEATYVSNNSNSYPPFSQTSYGSFE